MNHFRKYILSFEFGDKTRISAWTAVGLGYMFIFGYFEVANDNRNLGAWGFLFGFSVLILLYAVISLLGQTAQSEKLYFWSGLGIRMFLVFYPRYSKTIGQGISGTDSKRVDSDLLTVRFPRIFSAIGNRSMQKFSPESTIRIGRPFTVPYWRFIFFNPFSVSLEARRPEILSAYSGFILILLDSRKIR